MLVSSPSPSALRPSPSSPPTSTAAHPPLSPCSSSFTRRLSSTPAAFGYHTGNQHYESAADRSAAPNSPFTPRSSRVAIEELRLALRRHSVSSTSPAGPSGDRPGGGMSAGQVSLEGGISVPVSQAALSAAASGPNAALPNSVPPPSNGPSEPLDVPASAPSNPVAPLQSSLAPPMPAPNSSSGTNKRNSPNDTPSQDAPGAGAVDSEGSLSKKPRPDKPVVKILPTRYEFANPKDLVVLISSMLLELIRYNDKIPLKQGGLTRFHSRSPPRISVHDYLQRLTTHATLSPPILLSMVYYIDRLCALYPSFTVSSLTIHRFLITSATVASKGLSDSFWTNKTYSRVGGISLNELALLELEFLFRVEWRIVPQPEVLNDYYQSLAERCDGYEIQSST